MKHQAHTEKRVISHASRRGANNDGFTMAELLTVVAILAVLMAIAGIAITNYLKDVTLTEYDNSAKSIYLAAQNSIADLQASGEWDTNKATYTKPKGGALSPTAPRTDAGSSDSQSSDGYYYVTAETARENGILPEGTVDDDVRGKYFIIEYNYNTATVYGVFYSKDAGVVDYYQTASESKDIRSREVRRENTPIIGYFGGADASNLDWKTLKAPTVKVANGHIFVTDSNLSERALSTFQLLTIEGKDETLMLKLEAPEVLKNLTNTATVTVYRKNGTGFTPVIPESKNPTYLKLDTSHTYDIDIAALQAAVESASGQAPLKFATNEVVSLKSKCTSNKVLCRSVYGYAQGVWAGESPDLIFTSNVMADWETEATIDAYVNANDKLTDQQSGSQGNNTKGNQIEIALKNFYDDDTYATNRLCFKVDIVPVDGSPDEGLFLGSVDEKSASNGNDNKPEPSNTYYFFDKQQSQSEPNYETLYATLVANPTAMPAEGATYNVLITAYKVDESGKPIEPSPSKTLTITVSIHKSDATNYYYVKDSSGSLYAELVLLAGRSGWSPTVTWPHTLLAIDASSPLVGEVVTSGEKQLTGTLKAQGSYSIKFLKSNPSDNFSKDKTAADANASGIAVY